MRELAERAAGLWGLGGGEISLAAQRENMVFRVRHGRGTYALRFHRPGYRSDAALISELDWMGALARGGMDVPVPLALSDGGYLAQVGGHQVDVLGWVPGAPLGQTGELRGVEDRVGFCHRLGRVMARMHDLSDAWTPPTGFTRPAWDIDGLIGKVPLWGRFWEHPHLGEDRALLQDVRDQAAAMLKQSQSGADYGLIHADLVSENMLFGDRLFLIDFDDSGFGYRDFELATFLLRFEGVADYAAMRAALIEGYGARRAVDVAALDLFLLLRALTYVGWIADRLDEPGAAERSGNAIRRARGKALQWLAKYGR